MLTNCNTWRMRNALLIGRQLKVGWLDNLQGSVGGGRCQMAVATLLMATLIIVLFLFFYDFHFFFNFARPLRP